VSVKRSVHGTLPIVLRRSDLAMTNFSLEWDRDYGLLRRTGWSIIWNGHVVVELEPWFVVAIAKAFREIYCIKKYNRSAF
jgi:hypothetical protein